MKTEIINNNKKRGRHGLSREEQVDEFDDWFEEIFEDDGMDETLVEPIRQDFREEMDQNRTNDLFDETETPPAPRMNIETVDVEEVPVMEENHDDNKDDDSRAEV
eukprot:2942943-Heterocapsa_arctica.AAC.1